MRLMLWVLCLVSATLASENLETVYKWKYIDYVWDSQEQKDLYIRNGDYDYKNIVPIDVDRANDGRIFITAIRNQGVPASLATVSEHVGPSGHLLRPYPNWTWYNRDDCQGITNVYRVTIDECNKIYVLDNGYIGSNYTCPAQVLIFDLSTDQLVERIKIPNGVSQNAEGKGKLVTPVIEVKGDNCELENLFMADVNGHGLVIWNKNRLFRLEALVYEPDKHQVNVSIAGESFHLEDSLMGMAVSPKILEDEGSDLIFRPFSSKALYTADTRVLSRSFDGNTIKYRRSEDMMPSQATAMGISSRGTLFFGLTQEIAIGCWNRYRQMTTSNIELAAEDNQRLQFASGLKVIPSSRTNGVEEVWVLTNRLQKIMAGTQNFNEFNFYVLRSPVSKLVKNTICEPPGHMHI